MATFRYGVAITISRRRKAQNAQNAGLESPTGKVQNLPTTKRQVHMLQQGHNIHRNGNVNVVIKCYNVIVGIQNKRVAWQGN